MTNKTLNFLKVWGISTVLFTVLLYSAFAAISIVAALLPWEVSALMIHPWGRWVMIISGIAVVVGFAFTISKDGRENWK